MTENNSPWRVTGAIVSSGLSHPVFRLYMHLDDPVLSLDFSSQTPKTEWGVLADELAEGIEGRM